MKKVLALFLVFGLATVSSAAIELGIGQLGVREIWLEPSDNIIIVLGSQDNEFGATNMVGIGLDGPGSFDGQPTVNTPPVPFIWLLSTFRSLSQT